MGIPIKNNSDTGGFPFNIYRVVSDVGKLVFELLEPLLEVQCTSFQTSKIDADQFAVLINFHKFDLHFAEFCLNFLLLLLVGEITGLCECKLPLFLVNR